MSPTRRTADQPGADDDRDVAESADLLYRTHPREFVAARDARVRALRGQGRAAAATAVGRLRKPTVSAWLVNLLVADDPELADRLAELAAALRTAQEQLAGDELRALGRQRHELVAGLVGRARALSGAARVQEGVLAEVESSLRAALADPEVARQVLSGRLLRAADVTGFGPPPAQGGAAAAPPEAGRTRRTTATAATRAGAAEDRRAEAARRRAEQRHAAEQRRAEERRKAEQRLEARRRVKAAEKALAGAERDRVAAAAAAARAQEALAAAEREVDRLRELLREARAATRDG